MPRTRGERERVEGGRESFTLKVVRRRLEATRCEGKEKEKKGGGELGWGWVSELILLWKEGGRAREEEKGARKRF